VTTEFVELLDAYENLIGEAQTTMDPQACWNRITDAIWVLEREEARAAVRDLETWLRGGGYLPKSLDGWDRDHAMFMLNILGEAVRP
jgi:hypothetical protein